MVLQVSARSRRKSIPHQSYKIWAGCAIVTLDEARLFTDGRYFLQAEKQLDKLSAVLRSCCHYVFRLNRISGIGH
jgi:hypothetical protein